MFNHGLFSDFESTFLTENWCFWLVSSCFYTSTGYQETSLQNIPVIQIIVFSRFKSSAIKTNDFIFIDNIRDCFELNIN